MRLIRCVVALGAAMSLLATLPSRADDDAAKIAVGAAALIGVAALVHKNQHHKDDKHHDTTEKEAAYERGYQDGLHNASYHPAHHENSYQEGYNAGVHERNLRMSHYRDQEWEDDRHGASRLAMQACVIEVSDSANISASEIVPVKSRNMGGGEYKVEVASGYRHYTCTVDDDGDVRKLKDGHI